MLFTYGTVRGGKKTTKHLISQPNSSIFNPAVFLFFFCSLEPDVNELSVNIHVLQAHISQGTRVGLGLQYAAPLLLRRRAWPVLIRARRNVDVNH